MVRKALLERGVLVAGDLVDVVCKPLYRSDGRQGPDAIAQYEDCNGKSTHLLLSVKPTRYSDRGIGQQFAYYRHWSRKSPGTTFLSVVICPEGHDKHPGIGAAKRVILPETAKSVVVLPLFEQLTRGMK
tara:strand:+ start:119 stop:505 length:387 start_codon:yes stop_codon:yes gene_type:complete